MDMDTGLDDQPLMTSSLWTMLAVLAGSFVVSMTQEQTHNGVVVSFVDYGAVSMSVATLLLAAVALREALSPFSGAQRMPRTGLVMGAVVVAVFRLLYGLGLTS